MRPARNEIQPFAALALFLLLALFPAAALPSETEPPDGEIPSDLPGTAALLGRTSRGLEPFPTLRLEVDLDVHGVVLRGRVTGEFANPTGEVLDAVYVLPLPDGAAVDDLEMRIGERRIASVVQEKDEARVTYEAARSEGKKASLLEQRRPNLFTASVANINPGEIVVVTVRYLEDVPCKNGEFRAAFPMTFTPRYAPASPPAPDLGEAGSIAAFEPDPTLGPLVSIRARIDAGIPIALLDSPSHDIRVVQEGRAAVVDLVGAPVPADRDFVLRWKPARGSEPRAGVLVEDRDDGRYALLVLYPPDGQDGGAPLMATETLFIIDTSGSMDGPSIEQAKAALLRALDRLQPGDAFNLLRFNDESEPFRAAAQPADERSLAAARSWVGSLEATGGTEILPALVRGIALLGEDSGTRARRIVLVTDGAVANEEEVFRAVADRLGDARLHVVGIGSAPNRWLMRKLAEHGRGACAFVGSTNEVNARLDALLERIARPALTDVRLEFEGAPPVEAYPERFPDLYRGDPALISLKLGLGHPGTSAVLWGRSATGIERLALDVSADAPSGSGIATRWAKARIESCMDRLRAGADEEQVRREVIAVAKEFRLTTRYTSLVAVEELATADGPSRAVRVANLLPQGSRLLGDALPQGGTSGPLRILAGLWLTAAGAVLSALAWRMRT